MRVRHRPSSRQTVYHHLTSFRICLLGLRGVAVVAHGSSTPEGIANAVRLADRAVRERSVERTGELLAAAGATRDALREEPSETAGR